MPPRLIFIAIAVVCAHALALWALHGGPARPAASERAAAVVMVANLVEAPQPPAPPSPTKAAAPQPPKAEAPKSPAPKPAPRPAPAIAPVPAAAPSPTSDSQTAAASDSAANAPAAPATPTGMAATASPTAPPASAAPPKVELPSSSARYLSNAPPRYPPISKRMGEQGRVIVRALIDANGSASQASVQTSSGYERLDQTALQTVLGWRYVPGKRGGVPEAMWFNIPIDFVLD